MAAPAQDLHHVSLLRIEGRRIELEVIPLRQAVPRAFSSRRDMDRVKALAVNMSYSGGIGFVPSWRGISITTRTKA